jgi:hypothetical protein
VKRQDAVPAHINTHKKYTANYTKKQKIDTRGVLSDYGVLWEGWSSYLREAQI